MMLSKVLNGDSWGLAVAFDLVLANRDRKPDNLLVVPDPADVMPARATSCTAWLIDFGFSGLWPPNKFDEKLVGKACNDLDGIGTGVMLEEHERHLRSVMPAPYREALEQLDRDQRTEVLDRLRELSDDRLGAAIDELPDEVMTQREKALTLELLKARRDSVEKLLEDYWLIA